MPLVIAAATSGSTTVQATDAVTATITLPSTTDTLVGKITPSFTTTIGVGGATPSASGAGITFPATQSASTDANTLDDYEEGTWTPTSSGVTFSSASGTYTKIGRTVYLYCKCVYPVTATTNRATVRGLPFVAGSDSMGTIVDTGTLAYFMKSTIELAVGGDVINMYAPLDTPVVRNSTLSATTINISIVYTV